MNTLGIDVGGSGIKGAPVNIETGELIADRFRLPTPKSGKPKAMARVVARVSSSLAEWCRTDSRQCSQKLDWHQCFEVIF